MKVQRHHCTPTAAVHPYEFYFARLWSKCTEFLLSYGSCGFARYVAY